MEDITILIPQSLVEDCPSLLDPEAGWEFQIEPEVFEVDAKEPSSRERTIGIEQVQVISREFGGGIEMIFPRAWEKSKEDRVAS